MFATQSARRIPDHPATAMKENLAQATAAFADELRAGGFDLLHPMRVSWYNDYICQLGLSTDSTGYLDKSGEQHKSGEAAPFRLRPLPDFGRDGNALALLIGNSRALWPAFLRWLWRQPEPRPANPLDTYTEAYVGAAVRKFLSVAGAPDQETFWAADLTPARLVDMNRAARACGLTYFADEIFLSIHPTYGAWVAFRAVLVFDLPAAHLPARPPVPLAPLLSDAEAAAAKRALDAALMASTGSELSVDGMPQWRLWEAMRDCVGRGREHKYNPLQSEYHYVKDPRLLARALAQLPPVGGLAQEDESDDVVATATRLLAAHLTAVGADAAHGIDHALAVVRHVDAALRCTPAPLSSAVRLAVRLAALLHDADDRKISPGTCQTYAHARRVMIAAGAPPAVVADAVAMITVVACSANGNRVPAAAMVRPEMLWPRWADRLEATGEIGVVRCYLHNSRVRAPLFTEDTVRATTEAELWQIASPSRFERYIASGGKSASFIDHFYDKLLQAARPPAAIVRNPYLELTAEKRVAPLVKVCLAFGESGIIPVGDIARMAADCGMLEAVQSTSTDISS